MRRPQSDPKGNAGSTPLAGFGSCDRPVQAELDQGRKPLADGIRMFGGTESMNKYIDSVAASRGWPQDC
ncbi:hypothetical protein OG304_35130 [Streptomyces sp. NBC_00160]|uniref:hypothetical protein n=1 Tax=Streptomyces sp. NBC_00160 TaxID=2903628 RepID=UPI00225718D1|nr:hypothetical protein [Streptomyces sp. NBC_00160]MCX5308620.1 hypothetical protein [Streptomyces sp. NBC_00160]